MASVNTSHSLYKSWVHFVPVMLCFFAMGFVDLVGTASNYVQKDLALTNSQANLFPSLVFFWFFIFSVPTGMLMNRIGRKKTVLLSLLLTALSLIVPLLGTSYYIMLISFALLGIGNTIMQTSLNPLVSNLISDDKLASTLTFGQFVKAIASFLAPLIIAWGATSLMPFDLSWRIIFVIFASFSILSFIVLGTTPIVEERPDRVSSVAGCLKLLGNSFILLCFLGIVCLVGIDVGTNTTAPKIIMERVGLSLEEATISTTIYFFARTIGCFLGGFVLRILSPKTFFDFSVLLMLVAMIILFSAHSLIAIYIGIAMIGFGNSNIFSIIFSQAMLNLPDEKNEISGLMIMGLVGGTVFPFIMGFASDVFGQAGAIAVMTVGVLFLLFYTLKIKVV